MIIVRRERKYQPRGAVEIDWGNDLAKAGLVYAHAGTGPVADTAWGSSPLVRGDDITDDILYPQESIALGYQTPKYSGSVRLVLSRAVVTAKPVSMSVFAAPTAASAETVHMLASISDASDHFFRLYWNDSDTLIKAQDGDGVSSGTAASSKTRAIGTAFHAGARFLGSSRTVYVDGIADGSDSTSVSASVTHATPVTTVGQYAGSAVQYGMLGFIGPVAIWNTDIGDAGMREHYSNRWQIFRPVTRRRYFIPASGGGPLMRGGLTKGALIRGGRLAA